MNPRGIGALLLAFAIVIVASAAPTGARATEPAAPIAEWHLDESSGATASDATGHGHTGGLTAGASWGAADPPQGAGAVQLDGQTGSVVVPTAPALEPAKDMSVVTWVRSDGLTPDIASVILSKGNRGCTTSTWALILNGGLRFEWTIPDGSVKQKLAPATIVDGKWHQVAVVFSSTQLSVWIYVDGRRFGLDSTFAYDDLVYGLDDDIDGDLRVGASPDCQYRTSFKGDIDDVRFFDRVVGQDELMAELDPFATTTTMQISQTGQVVGSTIGYQANVSPTPPGGFVRFFQSKDGGPEQEIFGSEVSEDGAAGFSNFQGQHMLPGSYAVRAQYAGFGPAAPSGSNTVEFTIVPIPTTVTLTAPDTVHLPDESITLRAEPRLADTSLNGQPNGTVTFFDVTDGAHIELGTSPMVGNCCVFGAPSVATLAIPGRAIGTYAFEARFDGSDRLGQSTGTVSVDIAKGFSIVNFEADANPAQAHHPVTLTVAGLIARPDGFTAPTAGTFTIRDTDADVVLVSGPVSQPFQFTTSSLGVGVHHLSASFSGTGQHLGSTSDPIELTIAADVVEATGVGVATSTFYPVKDGYRDTVAIRGSRLEPVAVSIKVYSSTGKQVKSASLGSATGPYSVAWNGRNAAGTILAAGKYRVVQRLTDAAGTVLVTTSYVNLSKKRLVYQTKTLSKAGRSIQASGHLGTGKITRYSSGKVVVRGGNAYTGGSTGWAAVGYQFTLPAAAVYKSMSFGVYADGQVPPSEFGIWDFGTCAYSASTSWDTACFHRWHSVPTSLRWASLTGSTSGDRSGRVVRGAVSVFYGSATVVKVRLKVTYGVLQ